MDSLMYIKSRRIYKGYTQHDVAKYLSLTTQSYHNKEIGKTRFTMPEMYMLKLVLGLEEDKWNNCLSLCK